MLEGEDVLQICVKHRIKIEQYFFMYLIARKDMHLPDKKSLGKQYMLQVAKFKPEDIRDLCDRGFIDDFNSPGQYLPEMYILKSATEIFTNEEIAEELYNSYPSTFRLSGGARFIARAGGDKDEMLQMYLKKINYSVKKHEFVMSQLPIYVSLVNSGEVNGYKLIDFIRQELWDTIADMGKKVEQKGGDFGRDI